MDCGIGALVSAAGADNAALFAAAGPGHTRACGTATSGRRTGPRHGAFVPPAGPGSPRCLFSHAVGDRREYAAPFSGRIAGAAGTRRPRNADRPRAGPFP